jgi:Flp pilus assembly protein TadB
LDGSKFIVEGENPEDVRKVIETIMEKTKPPSPWKSGSFYLVVFLVVIAALAVVGHVIPTIALPAIVIGGIIALAVIGAFQMRQDEKLSQENFLKLMTLSLKYLPWIRREGKPPEQLQDEK